MYRDERVENKDHDNQIRIHGMSGRGNFDFIQDIVGPQVTLKKTYKVGIPPVDINIDAEEGNERNKRKLCMIEERHSNRDEKKRNNRNEKFHDTSVDSITVSYGQQLRKWLGSLKTTKR